MTPVKFTSHIRFMTRTNSTTLTDATILNLANVRKNEIASAMLAADEDLLLVPQTTDLVANQREYSFPEDALSRIKRIEAKLDGDDFIKLTELDLPQYPDPTDETSITNNFANLEGEAYFDLMRKSIVIYSGTITDVTDGLKLWCDTYPADLTDLSLTDDMSEDPSTTTHGVPIPLHEIWARGVIIDYKGSREKPIPLTEHEKNYYVDLARAIEVLKHGNMDREVLGHLPSTSSRGNSGFDY